MNKEDIIHYYDQCETDYRLLWDLQRSHAMHAGYWDSKTKTLRDALKRENEILAEIARIQKGERVLDAGCGVGGSSIFLAQHYQCDTVGITLSEKQANTASGHAQAAGVADRASFEVMDYTCTCFPDHSFDVVWGIESICHAVDKSKFIQEAARILKPGGRLIIADGFATQLESEYLPHDLQLMQKWLKGWGVLSLETAKVFKHHLRQQGFQNIAFYDITHNVLPSSKRLYIYSWPAVSLSRMGEWLGWRSRAQTDNLYSARCQYQALRKGLWQYGIFYAERLLE